MTNLLSELCVKTKHLAAIQNKIAQLQAEAHSITVDLALLASQCYQIRSDEV